MGASVHSVVNGVAFLALRVCSLVASKCLVVLPHCSCETYGLFFVLFCFPPCSFHLSWPECSALVRNIRKGGSGSAL